MKSKKDPVITLSVLKTVLNDSLIENNKALIAIMDDRFSRQWMAVESKFNELRDEMFSRFESADKNLDKKLESLKGELMQSIADAEDFTCKKTDKIKKNFQPRIEALETHVFGFAQKFDN